MVVRRVSIVAYLKQAFSYDFWFVLKKHFAQYVYIIAKKEETTPSTKNQRRRCLVCGVKAKLRCSGCGVRYCSAAHQLQDWREGGRREVCQNVY